MNIIESKYITSGVKPAHYPIEDLSEIALMGRSNVGKSSLINTLLRRKNLARTSSRPGKTQAINFYLINNAFYFADLPGYGFAKVSKSLRASWIKMMEEYVTKRVPLKVVVQVIDLRHLPSIDDQDMHQFLISQGVPVIIAATKADKISKGRWQAHANEVRKGLKDSKCPLILFSSRTGEGKSELWEEIKRFI